MATSITASPPQLYVSKEARPLRSPGIQDDDVLWTEYLKEASNTDARIIKDWTKVIDVLLVFVALFSGILTAFIIQISGNFQPNPADVTNKIIIAIYNRTMNDSAPIDLEQFLRLDDASMKINIFQNWLLYTSLTVSIMVAALAMAAKLWLVSYSREVTTSGPPRVRAKRRQEVYDGLVTWKLEKCIDAMPVLALLSVILFALFIHSAISVQETTIAYFVGTVFLIGISFIVVVSFSAAFIFDAPYRSPFSKFVNFIFRIFPSKPVLIFKKHAIRWRTISVFLFAVLILAVGGYFVMKQNYIYFPCVFVGIACVFALMRRGREEDMQPRLFNLALWALISSVVTFITFVLSAYFSTHSTALCIFFFALSSVLLCFQGYVGVKVSEKMPMTIEAEAVAWLLKTSSNKDPAWFLKAVQIAGQSPNTRAILLDRLLPLLVPLITSLPKHGLGGMSSEQEGYINTLAVLLDYTPREKAFWRNEASLTRPDLPEELIERLEKLEASVDKCSHKRGNNPEKWNDDTIRCPQECVADAVEHILQLQGSRVKQYRPEKLRSGSDDTV